MVTGKGGVKRRELRVRLPTQKWEFLDHCIQRGMAQTYADLIVLAIECFHDKLLQRDLQEARLRQLEGEL